MRIRDDINLPIYGNVPLYRGGNQYMDFSDLQKLIKKTTGYERQYYEDIVTYGEYNYEKGVILLNREVGDDFYDIWYLYFILIDRCLLFMGIVLTICSVYKVIEISLYFNNFRSGAPAVEAFYLFTLFMGLLLWLAGGNKITYHINLNNFFN